MEYPHGHHRHHHGRDEEEYPPAPPPPYGAPPPPYGAPPPPQPYGAPPPPQPYGAPPPQPYGAPAPPPAFGNYSADPYNSSYGPPPPGPPRPGVEHVSHESGHHGDQGPHHHRPHMPSFIEHHTHHGESFPPNKPTVRVYTKAETNYSLTIRYGKVILARSDPSDPFQHWYKDERLSTRVKDEEGFPSFALVNKATGEAIKHSVGATKPVQLIPYNANALDESVLWTESKDLGDGYRAVRMVNNIKLNVDAFNGDKNHGGVKDGTLIVLWEWKKGDNQRWKIVPH